MLRKIGRAKHPSTLQSQTTKWRCTKLEAIVSKKQWWRPTAWTARTNWGFCSRRRHTRLETTFLNRIHANWFHSRSVILIYDVPSRSHVLTGVRYGWEQGHRNRVERQGHEPSVQRWNTIQRIDEVLRGQNSVVWCFSQTTGRQVVVWMKVNWRRG